MVSTATDIAFYSLSMTDYIVTTLKTESCNIVFADLSTDPTGSTSVSGSTFSDGQTYYTLDDIYVYIYDESDDAWIAAAASALAGRKRSFNSIALIDVNSDALYDIAIVSKP